jgi:hypothetical protein
MAVAMSYDSYVVNYARHARLTFKVAIDDSETISRPG